MADATTEIPAAAAAAAAAAAVAPAETASPAPAAAKSPEPAKSPDSTAKSPEVTSPSTDGAASGGGNGKTFRENFKAFSKFGDTKSDGKLITLSQSDKWMKQAGVIDGKKITTTDTGIYFKKFKSLKIGIADYEKFMEELAKSKKIEAADLKTKMAACGAPGLTGTGPPKVVGAVDRLTDVSKYTGSHKQRFDQTGKGRGIAGRKDVPDSSGYVQGYQNKDSYSKTH